MRYIKIPADASQALVEMNPGEITTSELLNRVRKELNEAYPERVRIGHVSSRTAFDGVIMLVDEDGDAKRLPYNLRASYLYGTQVHGSPIVGDAIVVGEHVGWDGADFCDLPERWTIQNLDLLLADDDADALLP